MLMTSFVGLFRSGSIFVLILGCVLMSARVFAESEGPGAGFYQEQKEGWFWYQDPPLKPEENELETGEQLTTTVQPVENRYRNASLDDFSMEDIWSMYPDDFQELLDHVQNVAVQSPTENNVLQYLVMQDVARRKALAYTSSSMYVNQKYSDIFNINQVYPTSKPGVNARIQIQEEEIATTINQAKNNHALIYFTSSRCGFCEKQNAILHYFIEKYGWQIKPVDLSRNPGIADRFGITTTPTLLLIKKGMEDYMTVSVGVVALTELERKLYRAVRYLGGATQGDNFLMYDFQKGSAFDPTSILNKGDQPWKRDE